MRTEAERGVGKRLETPVPAELSSALARFAADTAWSDVPGPAQRSVKTSLIDQLGAILAGSGRDGQAEPFVRLASLGGGSGASIIGRRVEAPPVLAAMANGAMAHIADYEDTHDPTLVHPNASVVPAALAVAQAEKIGGRELLAALTVGAEINCRIAVSLIGNPQNDTGFLILPMIGAYGAAAAVGRLLHLDAVRMEQAFALAMTQAVGSAGVLDLPSSDFRAIRDGFNAKAGVVAAYLARDGVKSFARPLEGRHGLFALFAGGQADPARGMFDLRQRYEITGLSYKPWPSCRGTHAFIEGALHLRNAHGLTATAIKRIQISVSPFFESLCVPEIVRKRPTTPTAAKFSIPFTVATALVDGEVALTSFSPAALSNPAILGLAEKVDYVVESSWTQQESTRGRIAIILSDGRALEHSVVAPLGHPANPISPNSLREKFLDCGRYAAVPRPRSELTAILERIETLENLADVAGIIP